MLFNRRVARPPNRRRWLPSKQGALASITTAAFKNNTGTLLTSLSVPNVLVIRQSTKAIVLTLTSQVTHASTAVLTISNAALVAGAVYGVVTFDNNSVPTDFGLEWYTAA